MHRRVSVVGYVAWLAECASVFDRNDIVIGQQLIHPDHVGALVDIIPLFFKCKNFGVFWVGVIECDSAGNPKSQSCNYERTNTNLHNAARRRKIDRYSSWYFFVRGCRQVTEVTRQV